MAGGTRFGRHGVAALQIICTATLYFALGQVGFIDYIGLDLDRILLPSPGLAMAALLLCGLKVWPGILAGSFGINYLAYDRPLLSSALAAAAMTLGLVIGYLLLRRVGFRNELDRLRDLLFLVLLGATAATLIGAMMLNAVLVGLGVEGGSDFALRWLVAWLASVIGVLVLTPLLLVATRCRWPQHLSWQRVSEACAMLITALVIGILAVHSATELLFLVFPVLVWAAVRFQLAGAAPAIAITSSVVVYGAVNGTGPFAGGDFYSNLLTVQGLQLSSTLATLALAITITERNRARDDITHAANQLVEVVNQLDRQLRSRPLIDPPQPDSPRTADDPAHAVRSGNTR
jgi:integral membrane sensor domain MASE1